MSSNEKGVQDEFAFIERVSSMFTSYHQQTRVGPGDDAAQYFPSLGQDQVVCVDSMVEEVHFTRSTMTPQQLGYKVLAINLSDLAAMGAKPVYFLVSIAIPPQWTEAELVEIYVGMHTLAEQWGVDLLGGDTTSSPQHLMLTVTVLGEVAAGVKLLRSHAQPGDRLFLTGTAGDSAAGLDLLRQADSKLLQMAAYQPLLQRHQLPQPHLREGMLLARLVKEHRALVSLNDVSDGLASEASEVAIASSKSAEQVDVIIDQSKIPLSEATKQYALHVDRDPYEWALYGGEDFVLIGTLPENMLAQVEQAFRNEKLQFYELGHVTAGTGRVWLQDQGRLQEVVRKGYGHFGGSEHRGRSEHRGGSQG